MEKVDYAGNEEAYKKSDRLIDIIRRQELQSFTPNCNLKCSIICNITLIILFIAFGSPIIAGSNSVIQYVVDYTSCPVGTTCLVNITIAQTLTPPVFLYYELSNFYLNHRTMVKSRSFPQLRQKTDSSNYTKCAGALYISDMFDNDTTRYLSASGMQLPGNSIASPCGQLAKWFFNDTFTMGVQGVNTSVFLNETNITNNYDEQFMFKDDITYLTSQWRSVTDEHFVVWMQMETFSDFTKLWGRVDNVITPDYNVASFSGTKGLVLSTATPLGKASFIGYVLIVAAILLALAVFGMIICYSVKGTPLFDYENMTWD